MSKAFPSQFTDIGRAIVSTDEFMVNERKCEASRLATFVNGAANVALWSWNRLDLTQFRSAGAPDIQTGTWGSVAYKKGTTYAAPTVGDKIDITTDALTIFTVTFAGTETTPQLAAAAINAAAGVAIATWDPYNPTTGLIVGSRIAGNSSSITLANNTGTPLAVLFGGGYTGSTITGTTQAPTLTVSTDANGTPTLRMQALGCGALSSVSFMTSLATAFALQDLEVTSSFSPSDLATTWNAGVSTLFYGDPVKGTSYAAGFLPTNDGVNPSDCAMTISRNDGTVLLNASLGAASYAYLPTLSVRGAAATPYPQFAAQLSGVGYSTPTFNKAAVTSDLAYPYGAPWTTGPLPYPTNNYGGIGMYSAGTPFYFPLDVNFTSLVYRSGQ